MRGEPWWIMLGSLWTGLEKWWLLGCPPLHTQSGLACRLREIEKPTTWEMIDDWHSVLGRDEGGISTWKVYSVPIGRREFPQSRNCLCHPQVDHASSMALHSVLPLTTSSSHCTPVQERNDARNASCDTSIPPHHLLLGQPTFFFLSFLVLHYRLLPSIFRQQTKWTHHCQSYKRGWSLLARAIRLCDLQKNNDNPFSDLLTEACPSAPPSNLIGSA